jgi:hypothetical protein
VNRTPLDECIVGRVYNVTARNIGPKAVYTGGGRFIGIREKLGETFLDPEWHFDTGPPHGTVTSISETDLMVPKNMSLELYLGYRDRKTGKAIRMEPPKGWVTIDSGKAVKNTWPELINNDRLFKYLERLQRGRAPKPEESEVNEAVASST